MFLNQCIWFLAPTSLPSNDFHFLLLCQKFSLTSHHLGLGSPLCTVYKQSTCTNKHAPRFTSVTVHHTRKKLHFLVTSCALRAMEESPRLWTPQTQDLAPFSYLLTKWIILPLIKYPMKLCRIQALPLDTFPRNCSYHPRPMTSVEPSSNTMSSLCAAFASGSLEEAICK